MYIDTIKKKVYKLPMETKYQIMERLSSLMKDREEIVFAYAHGSFTENIPFHDIDLGVYVTGITKEKASLYALELSHILSNTLKIQTDVRVMNFAPTSFLFHVIRGHMISERDEDKRVQIMEDIIRKYLDIKPLIQKSIREAFAA